MRQMQPYLGRVLLVAVLITSAGLAGHARAQEDDVERDQAVGAVSRGPATRRDEGAGRSPDCPSSSASRESNPRDLLEMLLSRRLKSLASQRRLTGSQSNKLWLAGRADIKHFVDRLDQIAYNFASSKRDRDELRNFTRAVQQASSEVRGGFFVTDSLLGKTLARMPGTELGRGLAQVSILNNQNDADHTRSRLAALVEEERARQELMHLTSSIMFKRGFDQWVSETLGAGAAR